MSANEQRARGRDSDGASDALSSATYLVKLLDDAELFCSPEGEPFATVQCGDHRETWPLRSAGFKTWLMARYFETRHDAAMPQALQSALGVLEGLARARKIVYPVWTRLAEAEGATYLDLANAAWQAVEIDAEGWHVIADPPVKFRRSGGMLPLPTPVAGGQLDELRRFIPASDEDWGLIATWLLAGLRPKGPFPILALYGEQGSAKSTAARVLRALIDPAVAPLRSELKDTRDLMIAATNGWIVALDNLSHVPQRRSDALCSLSTGGGFATRMLFTDDVEKIFSSQRPVILNGIDEVATSGDLLDRAILVYLPHIPECERRTMSELWREFEAAKPRILGAALDAVVQGLRNLPNAPRTGLPRMADFAQWGCAVALAVGWDAAAFLTAYKGNRDSANDVALEASPVARLLLDPTLPITLPWEDTAGRLLELLEARLTEAARKQRAWPKSPRALSVALRRLAPNLRVAGLEVRFLPRQVSRRLIRIEKVESPASFASPASSTVGPTPTLDGWEQLEP